jgi:hypothetical protein
MPASSVGNRGRCGRTRARLVRSAALISMRWVGRSKLRSGPTPNNGRRCKPSGQQVSVSGAIGATPTLNHCQNDCGTLMRSYAATQSIRCASGADAPLFGPHCGHRGTRKRSFAVDGAMVQRLSGFPWGIRMTQESIAAAGNTEVPAYLTLIELGYSVERIGKDGDERWIAKRGTLQLMADCPLELLGLSLLRSERGPHWQASDNETSEFLTRFYPSAGRT